MQYNIKRSVSPIEKQKRPTRSQPVSYDCRICRKDHPLRRCVKFKKMTASARLEMVKRYKYCENCLAHSHRMLKCRSIERCKQCGDRHHTLLHRKSTSTTVQRSSRANTATLIPTVIIQIRLSNSWGQVRGLLNPCANISSIATFLIDRYHLPVERVGNEKWCDVSFRSRFDGGATFKITAKVTNDLPMKQPNKRLDKQVADNYQNLRLADPDFFESGDINMILGADIYPQLIRSGLQPSSLASLLAQDTVLGWTIIGKCGF